MMTEAQVQEYYEGIMSTRDQLSDIINEGEMSMSDEAKGALWQSYFTYDAMGNALRQVLRGRPPSWPVQ